LPPLIATDGHLVAACRYATDGSGPQASALARMQVLTTAPSPHRYDTDGSGEIDKSELFEMCLTVGQVIATDCH